MDPPVHTHRVLGWDGKFPVTEHLHTPVERTCADLAKCRQVVMSQLLGDAVYAVMADDNRGGFHWPPCPEESDMCLACNIYWRAKRLGIENPTLESMVPIPATPE